MKKLTVACISLALLFGACGGSRHTDDRCHRFALEAARLALECGISICIDQESCVRTYTEACQRDVDAGELGELEYCIQEMRYCDCAGLIADTCAPTCNRILD